MKKIFLFLFLLCISPNFFGQNTTDTKPNKPIAQQQKEKVFTKSDMNQLINTLQDSLNNILLRGQLLTKAEMLSYMTALNDTISKVYSEYKEQHFTSTDTVRYVIVPLSIIIIQLGIFIFQVKLKRRDEKLALQLGRLDKQLSKLYGPLYSLYHIGSKHFDSFKRGGHEFKFTHTGYTIWLQEVFMKTNVALEKTIADHADLFVGGIPSVCINFCQHVAALKTCIADINNPKIRLEQLDERMEYHPHPLFELQSYIIAAFVILKNEQNRLLSPSSSSFQNLFKKDPNNPRKLVVENKLLENILEERTTVFNLLIKSDDTHREECLHNYLTSQKLDIEVPVIV